MIYMNTVALPAKNVWGARTRETVTIRDATLAPDSGMQCQQPACRIRLDGGKLVSVNPNNHGNLAHAHLNVHPSSRD